MRKQALPCFIVVFSAAMMLFAGCDQPTGGDDNGSDSSNSDTDDGGSTTLADTAWVDPNSEDKNGILSYKADVVIAFGSSDTFRRIMYKDYSNKDPFSDTPLEDANLENSDERETGGRGTFDKAGEGTLKVEIPERYYYDHDNSEGQGENWGWYTLASTIKFEATYEISNDQLTLFPGKSNEQVFDRVP